MGSPTYSLNANLPAKDQPTAHEIASESHMQFHIENMTCNGCARSITKAIHSVDPTAQISADPGARTVDVQSAQPRAVLEGVLANAGYPSTAASQQKRAGGCCSG
jgi:copper chaperone